MKNNIFKTKPYRLWRTISCWQMLEGGIRAVSDVATGEPPWSNGYIHSHSHAEGPDAVKSKHQNKTKRKWEEVLKEGEERLMRMKSRNNRVGCVISVLYPGKKLSKLKRKSAKKKKIWFSILQIMLMLSLVITQLDFPMYSYHYITGQITLEDSTRWW